MLDVVHIFEPLARRLGLVHFFNKYVVPPRYSGKYRINSDRVPSLDYCDVLGEQRF